MRKLAHFSEFTLEGFLLIPACGFILRRFVRHVRLAMLGGMATRCWMKPSSCMCRAALRPYGMWIDFGGVIAGLFAGPAAAHRARADSLHAMKKKTAACMPERAELLRQQRADRINTADDRPGKPR